MSQNNLNSNIGYTTGLVLGYGLLGLFILGVFGFIIKFFISIIFEQDAKLGATLLTVFASVLTVVLSKVWELKIKNLQENRGKKEPIYEELLSFLFKIVKATKKGETVSEDEMEDFIFNFTEKVMIWGSDDVINAFYNFKKVGANTEISGNSDVKIADAIEELILAVRKDLGHSNNGLNKGKLLGLFIVDYDQYVKNNSRV